MNVISEDIKLDCYLVQALGCILYELCALRKPFDASNMPAIIFSIMRNKPQPIPECVLLSGLLSFSLTRGRKKFNLQCLLT
jgi:serine/threonine protein kinase